ncbi:hypothetical protein LguiB_006119 [Lonicera macranthoides]
MRRVINAPGFRNDGFRGLEAFDIQVISYQINVLVAVTIGVVIGLCVGPLAPVVGNWLARSSIMQFLLHITVLALALSSQFFPYNNDAPKRVVFQHTVLTAAIKEIAIQNID